MSPSHRDPKVDAFIARASRWRAEVEKLRELLLACRLEEGLKWGKPCYMLDGKNVAILQPFKEHCSLMFFKGRLLEDPRGLLRSQGANTQAAMRLEFRSPAEIKKGVVQSFVKQAIAVERAGLKVELKAKNEWVAPEEWTRCVQSHPGLEQAFRSLTPGRQRAYIMHFAGAKQSKTRTARIERCIPHILAGKGMNDR